MLYSSCVPSASLPLRVLHSSAPSAEMSSNQPCIWRAPPLTEFHNFISQYVFPVGEIPRRGVGGGGGESQRLPRQTTCPACRWRERTAGLVGSLPRRQPFCGLKNEPSIFSHRAHDVVATLNWCNVTTWEVWAPIGDRLIYCRGRLIVTRTLAAGLFLWDKNVTLLTLRWWINT